MFKIFTPIDNKELNFLQFFIKLLYSTVSYCFLLNYYYAYTYRLIRADQLISSDNITISRTTLKSLASQERSITINDVSGILMVTGFSNILTSTTLTSNHNDVVLASGTITLTLPDPTTVLGTTYTIKKIDTSANTITISGIVDGESNPQLSEQNSYISVISNGNSWYKVAEYVATATSSENQTYISNSLGMTFRLIPAGTFVMGSPTDELGRETDEAQYTVTLSEPYYIQTTEVTQGQWKSVMGNNPSSFTDCGLNCPVEYISWDDAQTFIATLNAMGEGSYTFPTEAQWEYAARAGSTSAFANGDIKETGCELDPNLDKMGWYCGNSCVDYEGGYECSSCGNNCKKWGTQPVAQKKANKWNLYDMHGNVYEWCSDWYGDYTNAHVTNPVGSVEGSSRVFRGGSWFNTARICRSAIRIRDLPTIRYGYIGFRLVVSQASGEKAR